MCAIFSGRINPCHPPAETGGEAPLDGVTGPLRDSQCCGVNTPTRGAGQHDVDITTGAVRRDRKAWRQRIGIRSVYTLVRGSGP